MLVELYKQLSDLSARRLQCQGVGVGIERRQRGKYGKVVVCSVASTKETSNVELNNRFPLQDILEAQQFDRDLLTSIFTVAREMEDIERDAAGSQLLKGYLMATLFYEPSTRTRLSFESAMKRLGGEVLTTENAREFSSAAKGETLEGLLVSFIFSRFFCIIHASGLFLLHGFLI